MRNDLTCERCLFCEVCSEEIFNVPCDDFADIDSDTYLDFFIEERRLDFTGEWFDYISEWGA